MRFNRRKFMKMTGGMGIAALGIGFAGCEASYTGALTVAQPPVADAALLWTAVDQGYIDEHFTDADVNTAYGSGKAASDAVLAGSAAVGFSSYGSPIAVHVAGTPTKFLYNGMGAVNVIGDKYSNQLIVADAENDDVTSDPATWEGLTVATNAPGNVLEFGVRKIMRNANVDDSTVEVTGVGSFSGITAALTGGTADFGCIIEPFFSMAGDSIKEIGAFYSWMGTESQITGWFTTDDNLSNFEGFGDAYVQSMDKAYDFWNAGGSNIDAYNQSIVDWTGADPDIVENGRQLKHYNQIWKDSVQKQGDILLEFGKIASSPDACDVIYSGTHSDC